MKRKIVSALLAMAMTAALFAGCGSEEDTSGPAQETGGHRGGRKIRMEQKERKERTVRQRMRR